MNFKKSCFLFIVVTAYIGSSFSAFAKTDAFSSTMAIRTLQTREFSNLTQNQAYETAISTFLDLGFLINETSRPLGLIEANQIHPNQNEVLLATLTLSERPNDPHHIIARLSLSAYPILQGEEGSNLNGGPPRESERIKTPTTYQQFFDAFSYALQDGDSPIKK